MDIRFNIILEDDKPIIKGRYIENNDLVYLQKFNPTNQKDFTSIDDCKEYIKSNHGFMENFDEEYEDFIIIKDKTVKPEEEEISNIID